MISYIKAPLLYLKRNACELISKILVLITNFFIGIQLMDNGQFINLMLFELKVCTRNAIKNIDANLNSETLFKNKKEIINIYKRYGTYPVLMLLKNSKENDTELNVWFWPIVVTFVCHLLGLNLQSQNEVIKYVLVIIEILVLIFVWYVFRTSLSSVKINFEPLDKFDVMNEFLKEYSDIDFNIDCLSSNEFNNFKENIGRYFKIINKIEMQEMDLFFVNKSKNIDIFNFDDKILLEKYGLNNNEISIYNQMKALRMKFFEANSIKEED